MHVIQSVVVPQTSVPFHQVECRVSGGQFRSRSDDTLPKLAMRIFRRRRREYRSYNLSRFGNEAPALFKRQPPGGKLVP
jgi:hypothetical protein